MQSETNSAMPNASMSRLLVKPRSRSTLTSTHSPWQSKPFCQRWSSPSIAWNRWNRSLYVRPQAWWTPIGLLAVIGPSRKLQRGPPAFWARSRANVRRSRQRARISCSWATRSGFAVTGRNIGPRLGSGPAACERASGYPTRDAAPQERAPRGAFAVRRRVPVPPLPGSRPCLRGRLSARPRVRRRRRSCCSPCGAGFVLRAHPGDLVGFVLTPWVLPSVFVLNILALLYRAPRDVDAYRVTVFLNAVDDAGGGRLGRPRLIFNPISIGRARSR